MTSLLDDPCVYCGRTATERDHLIPKSKGGPSTPDNMVPACHTCNMKKSNKISVHWLVPGLMYLYGHRLRPDLDPQPIPSLGHRGCQRRKCSCKALMIRCPLCSTHFDEMETLMWHMPRCIEWHNTSPEAEKFRERFPTREAIRR